MSITAITPSEFLPLPYKDSGLYFDFNSAAKIKEWTGCNIIAGDNPLGSVAEDGSGFRMDPVLLRAMLAACLYRAHRRITLDDAGALIRPDNMAVITEGVMRAFASFFGKSLEELTQSPANPTTEATTTTSQSL